jgi:DNA-binding response OmpR family regulator
MKGKVLIAEDERSIRSLLRTYLEGEDFQVVEAADGQQALDAAARESPDVMLLDLSMPPPQGMDVLRRVRQLARRPAVVILTAYGSVPLAVEAMRLGALDFLEKPADPDALLSTVTRIIRERKLSADPTDESYATVLARVRRALEDGDYELAEGLLMKAAALGDRDPVFFNLKGLLFEVRGDLNGARREYGQAISRNKNYEPAQQNMRRLYELREFGHSEEAANLG